MPRQRSDNYQTHRIELGVFERELVEKTIIPTAQANMVGKRLSEVGLAIASLSTAWVGVLVAFKLYPTLKDTVNEVLDLGKETIQHYSWENISEKSGWNPLSWLANLFIPNVKPLYDEEGNPIT